MVGRANCLGENEVDIYLLSCVQGNWTEAMSFSVDLHSNYHPIAKSAFCQAQLKLQLQLQLELSIALISSNTTHPTKKVVSSNFHYN